MVESCDRAMLERDEDKILIFFITSRGSLDIERMLSAASHDVTSVHLATLANFRVEIDLFVKDETMELGGHFGSRKLVDQLLEDEPENKDNQVLTLKFSSPMIARA